MAETQLKKQQAHKFEESHIEPVQSKLKKKQHRGIINQMQKNKSNSVLNQEFSRELNTQLLAQLKTIQEYSKLVSFEIKHQEDSISTLKPTILQRFTQLTNRKQLMIEKVQQNIKFLLLLLLPYKTLFQKDTQQQKSKLNHNHEHHSHQHGQKKYQSMVNLFYEIALQWGTSDLAPYISRTIQLLERYWIINTSHQNQFKGNQTNKAKNMLVVGCGTGRILSEIRNRFKSRETNVLLQGHSSELQHHICSQYFLNSCAQQSSIFPYVHNFSNFIKQSSPYREIIVPLKLQSQSYYYPLTRGKFVEVYKNHHQKWQILITCYNNYHIEDIFTYLKIIYKMLTPRALWIDLCTPNFTNNVVMMGYQQYDNILDKSQFKLLEKGFSHDYWFEDKECIMNQKRTTYYRVMQK